MLCASLKTLFLRLCLLTVFALQIPNSLFAQTGAALPNALDLASGSDFTAAPAADEINGVDLRKYFPPVGEQTMNDCAAWAVSAAKSCMEAYDQGWQPNRPATMFSPTWLYPQLNNGIDEGSSIVKAALLVIEKGAATLKTTPYLPNDHLTQPSEFAFEEASRFRNRDAFILENQEQIRLVLRENMPVVIGARLTPNFFSRNISTYTLEMHEEGMTRRQADQPHSMHAMVIVGYDNPTQRFLVRNSWGQDWGQGGYVWVDYDLIETIDPSKDSESFLFLAIAMEDILEDAEETPEVGEDLKQMIGLSVRGEPAGFDTNFDKSKYRFTAELKAPQKAIDLVAAVDWTLPTWNGGRTSLAATASTNRFRVVSSVGGEENEIQAIVTFKDGTEQTYSHTTAFVPLNADDRLLSVRSDDFYYGKDWNEETQSMEHKWNRVIRVVASAQDQRDLENLTIKMGDGPIEEMYLGNYTGGFTAYRDAFDSKPLPIEVHFTFSDGSQTTRSHSIDKYADPIDDGIWIVKELHPVGDGSQSAYRLAVRMPIGLRPQSVTWQLDGSQNHYSHVAYASGWKGHEITGSASRDFRARATIKIDGKPDVVLDEWIELPDDNTAYATPQRLDLWHESTYTGRTSHDFPRWSYTMRVSGDPLSTAEIYRVRFLYMDPMGEEHDVEGTRDNNGDWVGAGSGLGDWVTVTAKILSAEGALEIERKMISTKPIVDGIFLDVMPYYKWGNDIRWFAKLGGPQWHFSAEKVAYQYDTILDQPGWIVSREEQEAIALLPHPWQTVLSKDDGTLTHLGQFKRVAKGAGEVTAHLYYHTGDMETVLRKFPGSEGDWSGPPRDRVQLRVLESFIGTEGDSTAWFSVKFWLDASEEELATIDYMLLKDETYPWSKATRLAPTDHARARFDNPSKMNLRIVRKDASVEERTIEISCQAQRFHDLELSSHSGVVYLRGPLNLRQSIKKVSFRIREEGKDERAERSHEYMNAMGDFAFLLDVKTAVDVNADVEFKDGSKRTVSATLLPAPQPEPHFQSRDYFYGWDRGTPNWLTSHRLIGGAQLEGQGTTALDHRRPYDVSTSWPDYEVLDVVAKPEDLHLELTLADNSYRDLGPYSYKISSPTLESVELEVVRSWENPNPADDAKDEYIYRVTGSIKRLDEIERVEYEVRYVSGEKNMVTDWHEDSRWSLDGDGFRGLSFTQELRSVEATLIFHDGREPELLVWGTTE